MKMKFFKMKYMVIFKILHNENKAKVIIGALNANEQEIMHSSDLFREIKWYILWYSTDYRCNIIE